MTRLVFAASFLVISALSLSVHGQVSGGQLSAAEEEELRERYDAAVRAYRVGDFEEAALAYLDVYQLSKAPVLLYNAAYAFGRAGRYERALEEGRRVRRIGLDDAETSARNEARIAGWAARQIAVSRAEVARTLPGDLPEPSPVERSWFNWKIASGATLGAIGVSAFVGALYLSRRVDEQKASLREAATAQDTARYQTTLQDIERNQNTGKVLLVGGSVLTVGASALLFYGFRF